MKLNKMKIKVNNLGAIREGSLELGDLTIIAGKNNTGKTYLSYTIFCILDFFPSSIDVTSKDFSKNKKVIINVDFFKRQISSFPNKFNSEINSFFAVKRDFFKQPLLKIVLDEEEMFKFFKQQLTNFDKKFMEKTKRNYDISFEIDGENILLSTNHINDFAKLNQDFFTKIMISNYIRDIMRDFVKPFAVTSERTGISLFYKEMDLSTNSLLRLLKKQFVEKKDKINTNEIMFWLSNASSNYALPIKKNIDIVRRISEIKTVSIFDDNKNKKNKEVLLLWEEILHGEFLIREDDIYFAKDKKNPIPLHVSSSAAKSLLLLDCFIKKIANENSILIIDEPELNLHPEAQRYMARLLVQLVNAGIKVIITTHSDYIIRELNNLIMLSKLQKKRKSVLKNNNYDEKEYIDPRMVKAYICYESTIKAVTPNNYGLDIDTFDCLINNSNQITNSIVNALDEEVEDE